MLDAKAMLKRAEEKLRSYFPVRVQVEGITGDIDARMPRRTRSNQLEAGGFPPDWTASIVVAIDDAIAAAWQPAANQLLTVDGEKWLITEVQQRAVSFVLRLNHPDE